MTNQPVDTIRDGNLKANIWRNEGEKGAYYSITFSRTYTDSQGNPKDTQSFSKSNLLTLGELARACYGRTSELQREDFQSKQATEPERSSAQQDFRDKRQPQQPRQQQAPSRNY